MKKALTCKQFFWRLAMSTLWIVRLYGIKNPQVWEEDAARAEELADHFGLEPAQIYSVRHHHNLRSHFREQAKVGDRFISIRSETRHSEVFVSGPYIIRERKELKEHTVLLAERPRGNREMLWQ